MKLVTRDNLERWAETNFSKGDLPYLISRLVRVNKPNLNNKIQFFMKIKITMVRLFFIFSILFSSCVADKKIFEVENAELLGGASIVSDKSASGGYLVTLSKSGDGVQFKNLPEANKLAIRYASLDVGTLGVNVNDQPAIKVNIHSSGALSGSFLNAIIDIRVPKGAKLYISIDSTDVAINIDQIIIGNGDLDLPPDIWNLPALPVAEGQYPADWKGISKIYTVPVWWREAKFGAWSHWDPQSMPEQGDWYARGMYMEGNSQYEFHLKNFGHPSDYGYNTFATTG